ncbi:hypothetical protein [Lentibacillus salinarum]|uniref:IDEAL domain-containing protein n=1 Tax=Lentibacillus salinarum TaxID=446820 RepID=A0ABW3ZU07_9BACI
MQLDGHIISGEFDESANAFLLRKVKHLSTASILNKKQLHALTDYLHKHKHEDDGQVLTLYDQILVRLNQEEVEHFLNDLDKVKTWYH